MVFTTKKAIHLCKILLLRSCHFTFIWYLLLYRFICLCFLIKCFQQCLLIIYLPLKIEIQFPVTIPYHQPYKHPAHPTILLILLYCNFNYVNIWCFQYFKYVKKLAAEPYIAPLLLYLSYTIASTHWENDCLFCLIFMYLSLIQTQNFCQSSKIITFTHQEFYYFHLP